MTSMIYMWKDLVESSRSCWNLSTFIIASMPIIGKDAGGWQKKEKKENSRKKFFRQIFGFSLWQKLSEYFSKEIIVMELIYAMCEIPKIPNFILKIYFSVFFTFFVGKWKSCCEFSTFVFLTYFNLFIQTVWKSHKNSAKFESRGTKFYKFSCGGGWGRNELMKMTFLSDEKKSERRKINFPSSLSHFLSAYLIYDLRRQCACAKLNVVAISELLCLHPPNNQIRPNSAAEHGNKHKMLEIIIKTNKKGQFTHVWIIFEVLMEIFFRRQQVFDIDDISSFTGDSQKIFARRMWANICEFFSNKFRRKKNSFR